MKYVYEMEFDRDVCVNCIEQAVLDVYHVEFEIEPGSDAIMPSLGNEIGEPPEPPRLMIVSIMTDEPQPDGTTKLVDAGEWIDEIEGREQELWDYAKSVNENYSEEY